MKKTLYLLLTLSLTLMSTACSDDDKDKAPESKAVTITDFNILSLDCEWDTEKLEANKLYLINSEDDLKKLILCPEDGLASDVDFSKKTLLVVRGYSTYGIIEVQRQLVKYNDYTSTYNKYLLSVSIDTNTATVAQPWVVAVLTDKLSNNSKVEYVNVKW